MLLYRIFPYVGAARPGKPGHPLYLNPQQGAGRFDNPGRYRAWYMAAEPTGAVAETFAALSRWTDAMFEFPQIAGARRALGVLELPDDLPYVDLDDPRRLVELGVRPSQVVERNLPYTQALAARIYELGTYSGIRWWSFHRPQWRVYCLWDIEPEVARIETLAIDHPAVHDAAQALVKDLGSTRG